MQVAGKTALVTGANSGLGKAVATALAANGARVLMLCRSAGRGAAARDEIIQATGNGQVELIVCDLASQADIRAAAAAVHQTTDALHFLVNNAGTAFAERGLTEDGVERTLAVDHLAPFLLTHLLLDLLEAAAQAGEAARIVNVGTKIDTAMDCSDLNWERRPYRMMAAYGEAKLGNIHFTRELARRLAGTGVTVNCVFPGVFLSNLGGTDGAQNWALKLFAKAFGWALPKPARAAERVTWLLTADTVAEVSGEYFGDRKPIPAPAQADDPAANAELWRLSAGMVGLDGDAR
ncbi:SDR family NAD(P)-dependent oxidoreductase [uncultured Thiohalocapsa sp.]|uniref:SDR family NAD(P)-dependent oxidoreductase n=1 Tax=uncultured Thiohalocapsa sp. TaxID=768990 RepID=UPI0025E84064|nr:SDR family NAD(P)-dependent oxidoreductase [uncultured Thiohalocapsa sp.]